MKKAIVSLFLGCGAFVSTARAAVHTVTDFSAIGGMSTNAVVCVVGDTVTLPEGTTYTVNNTRVASIDGTTVTALEEGFTGIIDGDSNVGGLIVRPQPAGSGRVFVAVVDTTETVSSGSKTKEFQWCNAENWLCVSGDGAGAYPDAADDVAVFPLWTQTAYATHDQSHFNVTLKGADADADVTVGQIYIGTFASCKMNAWLLASSSSGVLRFSRTDGSSPRIAITGGCAATGESWLRVKSAALTLDLSQGLTVDMGYCGADSPIPHVFFTYGALTLPEEGTLLFINGRPNYSTGNATDFGVQFDADFDLNGAGTIRNDSDMYLRVDSEGDAVFTGTWESGGVIATTMENSTIGAGVDFQKATGEGRTVISDGGIKQKIGYGQNKFQVSGSRGIKIGSASGYGTGLDFYTDRIRSVGNVILNSGLLGIWPECSGGNGNADVITTRVDRLTFGYGLNKLYFHGGDVATTAVSTNFSWVASVVHSNRAQSVILISDLWNDNPDGTSGTNHMVKVKFDNLGDYAIGGVIPWMMSVGYKRGVFVPMIDEDGCPYYDMPDEVTMAAAEEGEPFTRLSTHKMSEDKTLNAVHFGSMRYKGASEYGLGAGRTLTVSSGAVILQEFSFVGSESYPDSAGTLVFGAPGYVYSTISADNHERRPRIYTPMVASQGIAFSGLADCGVVLLGDQTGIAEELAVNGTTVVLGTNTAVNLDVDIRVAGGFSVLDVENVNTDFLKGHTLTLQDSGNYPARVILASNTTYRVGTLYVGGKKMKSGTYGSSDSDAAKVDDEHFSGPGMLEVAGIGLTVIVR